jgi:hypothetical protein
MKSPFDQICVALLQRNLSLGQPRFKYQVGTTAVRKTGVALDQIRIALVQINVALGQSKLE